MKIGILVYKGPYFFQYLTGRWKLMELHKTQAALLETMQERSVTIAEVKIIDLPCFCFSYAKSYKNKRLSIARGAVGSFMFCSKIELSFV
jgi:hypothetical protein